VIQQTFNVTPDPKCKLANYMLPKLQMLYVRQRSLKVNELTITPIDRYI